MTVLARDSNGNIVYVISPGATQNVAIGAGSLQSTAFGTNTTLIRIVGTAACHYAIGANPTASATTSYLPANVVEYIGVAPGQKIAVIQDVGAGTFNITEGA